MNQGFNPENISPDGPTSLNRNVIPTDIIDHTLFLCSSIGMAAITASMGAFVYAPNLFHSMNESNTLSTIGNGLALTIMAYSSMFALSATKSYKEQLKQAIYNRRCIKIAKQNGIG